MPDAAKTNRKGGPVASEAASGSRPEEGLEAVTVFRDRARDLRETLPEIFNRADELDAAEIRTLETAWRQLFEEYTRVASCRRGNGRDPSDLNRDPDPDC